MLTYRVQLFFSSKEKHHGNTVINFLNVLWTQWPYACFFVFHIITFKSSYIHTGYIYIYMVNKLAVVYCSCTSLEYFLYRFLTLYPGNLWSWCFQIYINPDLTVLHCNLTVVLLSLWLVLVLSSLQEELQVWNIFGMKINLQ